ncbi:hypothetical protein JTB14_005732 [Gonioctena quinquepunctata]|nr:hypothetical protein JTB14_005732 [Gonioctena quinquepunctata]
MVSWPFCLGIVIGPSSLAANIRCFADANEIVKSALYDMIPLLISRNEELAHDASDGDSVVFGSSSPSEKNKSRLSLLEEDITRIKELLETIIIKLEVLSNSPENYWSDGNPEEFDGTPLNSDQEDREEEASPWVTEEDVDLNFTPKTKGYEPPIPAPKANIESQGIYCLRLGKTSLNKIR